MNSIVALLLIVSLLLLIIQRETPAVVRADASPAEFSAARALTHLQVISREPHPVGSREHAAVRDYLINTLSGMGLQPEIQKSLAVKEATGAPVQAATLENVFVRLKGKDSRKSVVLVSHYDSVPTSRGASDDGSGVVSILESLRALKAGQPLRNDVIALFTDGEEIGLMGARAFVEENPLLKDVGVVLNFEARGNTGPSLMFETSEKNSWLINEFAEAAPHPIANSVFYEIYRRLANDTDFTEFKNLGYEGMNFAYIDGLPHYHTLSDDIENLNQRSLQHQGSYALALARQFGNSDFVHASEGNAVYFDIIGLYLVHYSASLAVPLAVLTLLLFVWALFIGFKKRRLTASGIGLGFLALTLAMVGGVAVVSLVWFNISSLHRSYGLILQGGTYNRNLYIVGFTMLVVACLSSIYIWFRMKLSDANLFAGGLLWWVVLMILTSLYLPGASYLFTLPLLFMSLAAWSMFTTTETGRMPGRRLVVLYVCALPALLLVTPVIHTLFVALPSGAVGGIAVLLSLLYGLLLPLLNLIAVPNKWLLPGISILVSLSFIVAASATSGFSRENPQPTNIFYALNADSGKAVWASTDAELNEWTTQFFAAGIKRGAIADYIPSKYDGFLSSPAPVASLESPHVALLGDESGKETRTLRLHITSPRGAPFMSVNVGAKTKVLSAVLNGRRLKSVGGESPTATGDSWRLFYYAPPQDGIELSLEVQASEPVQVNVIDQSFQLPDSLTSALRPRPIYMMPTPYPFNSLGDATIVSKTFSF